MSQLLAVVKANACKNGDVGVANVCRIKAPSHPHFEDRDVHARAREENDGDNQGPFEKSERSFGDVEGIAFASFFPLERLEILPLFG